MSDAPLSQDDTVQHGIAALAGLVARSHRIAAFTGAGISTESGIPDFRSPGGVWDRNKPIQFRDFLASAEARRETWRRGLETYPVVAAARPNAAHLALVELERRGKLLGVVTQNIDGLHLAAGHDPERIIELHGNAHGVKCLTCDDVATRELVHARVIAGEVEPPCRTCGGILKPTTVSFGEPMPRRAMARAEALMRQSDLVLVVGSTLIVYPAAGLPQVGVRAGAELAIVNLTPTPLDDLATVVVSGRAGEILPPAVALAAELG